MTAKTRQMQKELDLVWEILLPAFKPEALPEDPDAQAKLKAVIEKLEAHPAEEAKR